MPRSFIKVTWTTTLYQSSSIEEQSLLLHGRRAISPPWDGWMGGSFSFLPVWTMQWNILKAWKPIAAMTGNHNSFVRTVTGNDSWWAPPRACLPNSPCLWEIEWQIEKLLWATFPPAFFHIEVLIIAKACLNLLPTDLPAGWLPWPRVTFCISDRVW